MVAQHLRQTVIGDAAVEVMDVMHADIGREPAQRRGQIVMRTAVQRRFLQIPFRIGVPNRVLELVLHIEQPNADRGGEKRDRKMNEQDGFDADQPDEQSGDELRSRRWSPWRWPRAASRRASAQRAADAAEKTDKRGQDRTSPGDGGKAGMRAGPSAKARNIRARSASPRRRCRAGRDCRRWRGGWRGFDAKSRKASR